MSTVTEYEQVSIKLLKSRVMLRVFKYLYKLIQDFNNYKKLFVALYQDEHLKTLSRGQILQFIREKNPEFTTVRASNVLNDFIRKKFIKTIKNSYGIEKYDNQFVIIKKKVFAKAAPIAEYLDEDIQSVISALKTLRRFTIRTTILLPFPLVKSTREPEKKKHTNSWTLSQEGINIGKYIISIFQDRAPRESKSGLEASNNEPIMTIGQIYEGTCSKILKKRTKINEFIKKLQGFQEALKVKLNECSTIRGRSIDEIYFNLSILETENENNPTDMEDLINTIKFIKFNMGILAELKILLKDSSKNLQNILDAQKGVFDIEDFPKIVSKMYKNFNSLRKKFDIPKFYSFSQWNQLARQEKDVSFLQREVKSLDELVQIDFNQILNVEHIYDLKSNIERFVEGTDSY